MTLKCYRRRYPRARVVHHLIRWRRVFDLSSFYHALLGKVNREGKFSGKTHEVLLAYLGHDGGQGC